MTSGDDSVYRVGRYALYDVIGSGAMARVHVGRARGDGGFSATVAVKRLRPELISDADFVARFIDEARLSACVRHPNVVQTLDVISARGELFVVMEYVHGESLGRLSELAIARGEPLSPALAGTLIAGVLRGLHAAHEATGPDGRALEIVHRDVSPQNILVDAHGTVRVLDFGVAKAAGRLAVTRDGRIRGKLAYMAPEQLRGQATRSSDVYASAVVLWELLTGRPLFSGERDTDVIEAMLLLPIDPPSLVARGDDARPTEAMAALDRVVMCGLSRNPADRFATAREMAVALEAAIPLVPTDEVAAWVARLAAVSLREKRAMVARIEALSAMDDAGSAAPVLLEPGLARPRKRRRAPIVAAAILAAAAAAYAIGRLPTSSTPAAAATAVAPDPAPLASVPPSEAPKTLPPAVVPTRDAARDRPTLPPVHPRARAVSGAPVGRASACDPPFSFDDAGRKLYKESCLR